MKPRIGIITAQFNAEIVEPMVIAAQEELKTAQAEVTEIIRVPGSYEIPLAANILLQKGNLDALIVLGYIERGETLHGEVMGHVVHTSIVDLQL
ncbi:MAG TPA: 6,7-dimethyl-8-ribityllumazine synthase, partial [Candidatus Andersenbacteria bacterium]|nr:6,7-dimethyl-8-ribityllumazine synthase [Candidatus Andersenbacteria bacterium]